MQWVWNLHVGRGFESHCEMWRVLYGLIFKHQSKMEEKQMDMQLSIFNKTLNCQG